MGFTEAISSSAQLLLLSRGHMERSVERVVREESAPLGADVTDGSGATEELSPEPADVTRTVATDWLSSEGA